MQFARTKTFAFVIQQTKLQLCKPLSKCTHLHSETFRKKNSGCLDAYSYEKSKLFVTHKHRKININFAEDKNDTNIWTHGYLCIFLTNEFIVYMFEYTF